MNPLAISADVHGFYADLGVALPTVSNGTMNATVACFVRPEAHRHDDRNKSTSVSVTSGAFKCFGCGAQGGPYDAAIALRRSPRDAMLLLDHYGLISEGNGRGSHTVEGNGARPTTAPARTAVTEEQVHDYHVALMASEPQVARLAELRAWSPDALERFEVGVDTNYSNPKGGGPIVFPSRDENGTLTGAVHYQPNPARRVKGTKKSWATGPRQLYPPPEAITGDTAWLLEGEGDALAAQSAGLPAVGVPGAEGWKDTWAPRFARFKHVAICTDADEAGRRLSRHLVEALSPYVEVRCIDLSESDRDGTDFTDLALEAAQNGGVRHLRELLIRMAAAADPAPTVKVPQLTAASPTDEWPKLSAHALPEFPVDALPPAVASWASAIAEESQTPSDLAAVTAVGVLSAAGMGAAVVDCGAWEEELALYLLVAMPSGDRKSTVLRAGLAPLRALERERRDQAGPDVRELHSRRAVLERREKKLIDEIAKTSEAETQIELEAELTQATQELAGIGEPVMPRLLADDATAEALSRLLSQQGSIAVIAAESALLDNLGGRYSEGVPNLHLICAAYSGESTVVDRKQHDPEEIERPLVTIGLAVQPHVLEALVSHRVARAQGLVARFAYALPETQLGRRRIDAEKVPDAVQEGWAAIVRRVFETPKKGDKSDRTPDSRTSVTSVTVFEGSRITLAPGAKALLDSLRTELEPRLAEDGDLRPVADWIARHAGRVARIAGLLHLAEHAVTEPIGEATMRDARRIGDYLLAHGLTALTGFDPLARRALKWLARRGQPTVTQRDLHRGVAKGGTAEDAAALARRLEQLGALRPLPSKSDGTGRPPSAAYDVNPYLLGGAAKS
jgi:hypothetical protein